MPQDALPIALEHHRAGRLRQAEAGYRAILEAQPDQPDALHWLGVMFFQAGRADEALPLLRRAAAICPTEAGFWHNLGQACLSAGQAVEAIAAFERTCALDPRAQSFFSLGLARLARRGADDARASVDAFQRARAAGFDQPELYHHLAMAHLAAGDADSAAAVCREALDKNPDDPLAHYHLAAAQRRAGQSAEVRKSLLKALELDQTLAQAWHALATLDEEAGNLSTAAGLYRRAIRARQDYPAARTGLARVLQALGRQREASQAQAEAQQLAASAASESTPLPAAIDELERRLTDPSTAALHYALAAQGDIFPPTHVPASLVSRLFDRYAGHFDDRLGGLSYCVPEMLAQALLGLELGRDLDVLDLGCGTGLCAAHLRPLARTLAGVDLSPGMIDKARERNIYDRLEVGELVEALRKSPRSWDLLIAADVLIYLGDLAPTFEAAAQALRRGGVLAFSVEAGGGDRYHFNRRTRRFTHSHPYLQHLAAIHGFRQEAFEEFTARYEAGQPVHSYLMILRT
jgi:predicted TPR repeat methyltransferase